jgi:hypothetical protein
MPPPDSSKNVLSRETRSMTSGHVIFVPAICRASAGHASAHAPQAVHREGSVPFGQTARQLPHPTQRSGNVISSGRDD